MLALVGSMSFWIALMTFVATVFIRARFEALEQRLDALQHRLSICCAERTTDDPIQLQVLQAPGLQAIRHPQTPEE